MNIIEHTTQWYKGEIFEALVIAIVGFVLMLISGAFWKFGKTPNAQAMVIPILVVGILLTLAGIFMIKSNGHILQTISPSIVYSNPDFIASEKQRVENFQSLYTYTKIGAGICFTLAIALFFVTKNNTWQAIAISLILLGLSGLTIDYFSKERADIYYQHLLKHSE